MKRLAIPPWRSAAQISPALRGMAERRARSVSVPRARREVSWKHPCVACARMRVCARFAGFRAWTRHVQNVRRARPTRARPDHGGPLLLGAEIDMWYHTCVDAHVGRAGARTTMKAMVGALRAARVWRAWRLALHLSCVRITEESGCGSTRGGEPLAMLATVRSHPVPALQDIAGDTTGFEEEAARWSSRLPPKWSHRRLAARDAKGVLRRARRTAPGPGSVLYAMWRQAGNEGAETLCLVIIGFADGVRMPGIFNDTWLSVLSKGEDTLDIGETVRRAESLAEIHATIGPTLLRWTRRSPTLHF